MFTPLLWINPLESFKWCLGAINVDKRQLFNMMELTLSNKMADDISVPRAGRIFLGPSPPDSTLVFTHFLMNIYYTCYHKASLH